MRNVEYCQLKFAVIFIQDCKLPRQKVSMLTGAMISKFRHLYCIYEGRCLTCSNSSLCIITNMTGISFDITKPLAEQSEASKFLLKCSDNRTKYKEGDKLEFEIILFDNLVGLASQYMYVFDSIGKRGIGPNKAKYQLLNVLDMYGNLIYETGCMYKDIAISDIDTYISSRLEESNGFSKMFFISSFNLQIQEKHTSLAKYYFISEEALYFNIKNRLNSISMFEKEDEDKLGYLLYNKGIFSLINVNVSKPKYYIKKEQKHIIIPRFNGYIVFKNKDCINPYIKYLLACEKLCIGQNILLGFGQYIMEG